MSNNDAFEDLAQFAMERAVAYRQESDGISVRPTASVDELRSLFDVGLPEQGRGGIEVLLRWLRPQSRVWWATPGPIFSAG